MHDQELFQRLRAALRSDGPMELLAIASSLVEVTDPRSKDPFAPGEQQTSLVELVESLVGTPYAETTAALTAVRNLVPDDVMAARIGRELAVRHHPMPDWLAALGHARLEPDVWLVTHTLGDGDDYLLGVTLPSGHALSALVYVDHNLGTVVKDAFIVPELLEDLVLAVGRLADDPDQSLTRTDPATARAVIEAAIDAGSRVYPPLTSDTWPMCRPVVEWMVRMLPAGGAAPRRKEWSQQEIATIAEDFFASPFGAPVDRDDERDLLGSVLWFGTSYATGDPWRWSPVTVELILTHWFPHKVIDEPSYLAKLPSLLRAWIRYCHDRNGIRADLTAETLAAVDRYEPQYQALIRGDHQKVMAGLGEALLAADRLEQLSDEEIHIEYIADEVGGVDALMALDVDPLPDEQFDWTGIPDEVHPVVQDILDACDACADARLDVEHRTAMRRFLARAAWGDPKLFRRKASPARGAAAVAWVVATANRTVGSHRSAVTGADLLAHFGISGSVSDRARSLLRAAGIDLSLTYGSLRLGDPSLLVSRRRRELVDDRDRTLSR